MNEGSSVQLSFTQRFKDKLKQLQKRYRSVQKDLQPLLETLEQGETPGDQIPQTTYEVFKARLPNRDAKRGKSGGYRVIYWIRFQDQVVLLDIYSKSDQDFRELPPLR